MRTKYVCKWCGGTHLHLDDAVKCELKCRPKADILVSATDASQKLALKTERHNDI